MHTFYTWLVFDSGFDKTKRSEPHCDSQMWTDGRRRAKKTHVLRKRSDRYRPGHLCGSKMRSIELRLRQRRYVFVRTRERQAVELTVAI